MKAVILEKVITQLGPRFVLWSNLALCKEIEDNGNGVFYFTESATADIKSEGDEWTPLLLGRQAVGNPVPLDEIGKANG